MIEETKLCNLCNEERPLSAFGKNRNQCRKCRYRIDYDRNAIRINRKQEEYRILRTYGITRDEYLTMKQSTEYCAICGATAPDILDHDSETGTVREFLCGNCNRGLGMFKHNPEILRDAANYLEKWDNEE